MRWFLSLLTPSRLAIIGALILSFFLSVHHRATTLQTAIGSRLTHLTTHLQSVNAIYHRLDASVPTLPPPPASVTDQLDWVRQYQTVCYRQHQQLRPRMGPIDQYDDQQAWALVHDERRRVNATIDVYNQYIRFPWRAWALSKMGWVAVARFATP